MTQAKFIKFEPEHLIQLELQEEQRSLFDALGNDPDSIKTYGQALIERTVTGLDGTQLLYTAVDPDGNIIGCGGLVEFSPTCVEAWLLLNHELVRKYARDIIPVIKYNMGNHGYLRTQAFVDVGFERAEKFLELLGFEYEATLRSYGLNGIDQKIFCIIK